MHRKTLLSDIKKFESAMQVDSVSSMYLLPGNQVLLRRYITVLKGAILPPLDSVVIVIHLGGKKITRQEDTSVISTPSTITFVAPSGETVCEFQGSADLVTLLVTGEAKKRVLASIKNNQRLAFADPIIPAIARQLTAESVRADRKEGYCDCLMEALLQHLIQLLEGNQAQEIDTSSPHCQQIQKVINYIHRNLRSPLTIDQLAQVVGLNPSWFRQLFKQIVGMTVHRYIMHQRLESARDLLANTDMPLLQLAHETGFSTQSHFTVNFKKVYGVTPLQYRKSPSRKRAT